MSRYTFKDDITLQEGLSINYLDSTGVSRANTLRVNAGITYLSAKLGSPLYINNTISTSNLYLNMSGGSPVISRSRMGFGFENSGDITADITVRKRGIIGTASTTPNSFLGITGGYDLTSTSGSRIILYGNTAIGTSGSLELYTGFNTQGSIRMYTGDNSLKIQVNNSGSTFFTPDGSNIVLSVRSTIGSFNVPLLVTDTSQSIGVGTGGSFTVNGGASVTKDLYVGGTMTSSSDARLKKEITELSGSYLDLINDIRTVKYKFKDSENVEYGFIAQDFIENFPELVRIPDQNAYYTLDYQKMTVILLKCIKELKDFLSE